MNFIAQVIRPACLTIFFIAPSLGLVDVAVRNLMDFNIEALGFDKRTGISKFKFMQVCPRFKADPLRKHLVFNENGIPVKRTAWSCLQPSAPLATAYNEKRRLFMQQQITDAEQTLESGEAVRFGKTKPKKPDRPKLSDVAIQILQDQTPFMDGKKYVHALIQEQFHIGRSSCQQVIRLVKLNQKRKKAHPISANSTLGHSLTTEPPIITKIEEKR